MNLILGSILVGAGLGFLMLVIRHSAFGIRHSVPIQLPTLLKHPPVSDELMKKTLVLHFEHPGVQACFQALETEAAVWQANTLQSAVVPGEVQRYHAGGAAALLRVLNVMDELRQQK